MDGDTGFVGAGRNVYRVPSGDVSGPASPAPDPVFSLASTVRALALADGLLYAASDAGQLCSCAVAESCAAGTPSCTDTGLELRVLSADKNRVIAGAADGTVQLFELDESGDLRRVSGLVLEGRATSIRLLGNECVVGLYDRDGTEHLGGFSVLDVAHDGGLKETDRQQVGSPVVGVGFSEDSVVVAEASGLVSVYATVDGNEVLLGSRDLSTELTGLDADDGSCAAIGERGDLFLLAVSREGIAEVGRAEMAEPLSSVATHGTRAIVGRFTGGWFVLDTADASAPSVARQVDDVGVALALGAVNGAAAAASSEALLEIVKAPVGQGPSKHVSEARLTGPALAIAFSDLGAQVAAGRKGLLSLIFSNDTYTETFQLALPGWATDVVIREPIAYMASGDAGVAVVSLAEPAGPSIIRMVGNLGDVRILGTSRGDLVAASSDGLVHLLDITTPASPRTSAAFDVESIALSLAGGDEGALFVGTARGDVQVWDVSDNTSPRLVDSVGLRRSVRALAYDPSSAVLYAAVGSLGLAAIHETDPGNWALYESYASTEPVVDVVATEGGLLVASSAHGLRWTSSESARALIPVCVK